MSTLVDRDPRPGRFNLLFNFGDLVNSDSDFITGITHYEVVFVDASGHMVAPLAWIDANMTGVSCCGHTKYQVVVRYNATAIHNGTMRLALTARSEHLYLPYLAFSDPIIDITEGKMIMISGSWSMKMSPDDASEFVSNPKAKQALGNAFAAAMYLRVDHVFITDIWIGEDKVARRLADPAYCCPASSTMWGDFCDGPACDVTMKVHYEVNTPHMNTVVATDAPHRRLMLQEAVEREAAAIGVLIKVTELPTADEPFYEGVGAVLPEAPKPSGNVTVAPVTTVAQTGSASMLLFPSMAFIMAVCSCVLL